MCFDWTKAAIVPDADEVRALADIVAVISSRMKLHRKGREFVGICPFHEDRSPSMAVITHKGRGFYKCHACGAGGDAVRFVMEFDGVDYPEALRRIADGFTAAFAGARRTATAPKIEEYRYREDCGDVIAAWRERTTALRLAHAAETLGVSPLSLVAFGFAWCPEGSGSYAFPMHDETGAVCGIRLREPVDEGAAKWALTGSRSGLFIANDARVARVDRVIICEGPTDAVAVHGAVGHRAAVIGRASCTGQEEAVARLARAVALPRADIVVVADRDGPGLSGAEALVTQIGPRFGRARVVAPPCGIKDARAWMRVRAGARATVPVLIF